MNRDFWSRRRAAVAEEASVEESAADAARRNALEAEQAEKSDAEILAELGLPDPDTLGPGEDVRGFLTDAVPARLRTRALRRLWRVNPALANLDGLLDYGEDFTDAATVVENLQTAYQVGKGMLAHVEALAAQAEALSAAETAPAEDPVAATDPGVDIDGAADPEPALSHATPGEGADRAPEPAPAPPTARAAVAGPDHDAAAPAPRRRMQFSFQQTGAA